MQLWKAYSILTSDSLIEQVAQVEKFDDVVEDAPGFFRRNYFTGASPVGRNNHR